ncbi:MAG: transglycosylase SLT domain-containing protein [Salinisphaera sp.]|nr:transglycosylase SLT domain-containing protein [Salinisphaera sp.]
MVLLLWLPAANAWRPVDGVASAPYADRFERAARRYLPAADAAWGYAVLVGQCYQESLLDPAAVSAVGAQGLCQFMPATWAGVAARMDVPRHATAFMPRYAIPAAASYMHRLRAGWSSPRPEWDRHTLALASYNAGFGSLLAAQRASGGAVMACPILSALPQITGQHARETRTYVRRVWRWWRQMRVAR